MTEISTSVTEAVEDPAVLKGPDDEPPHTPDSPCRPKAMEVLVPPSGPLHFTSASWRKK